MNSKKINYPRPKWPDFDRFRYDPARDVFHDRQTGLDLKRVAFNALFGRRHTGAAMGKTAAVAWLDRAPPECFVYVPKNDTSKPGGHVYD